MLVRQVVVMSCNIRFGVKSLQEVSCDSGKPHPVNE